MSDQITSDHPMPSTKSKTTNILTFDGGGVRGLSSLIILKCLMKHVNEQEGLPPEGLTPKDIFSLVAGTSTGGLIAIMLGRFGMSVDDCIVQYWTFSKEIFGHYSILGKWSWGILKERYDGGRLRNSVRQLAARKDICDNQSVMMQGPGHKNGIPCTVLAAEFDEDNIRDEAAYLCSHDCEVEFQCRVCDAAQATTAAPSYFPLCRIGNRDFIDGGFGHNNPSFDIYTHYTNVQKQDVSPRVDMNKILIVNIGTGVDLRRIRPSDEEPRRQPPTRTNRHRSSLTGITNMVRQMKAHATDAQGPFYILKAISRASDGMLDIHRFSADTGLHKIGLDKYRELKDIEQLTNEYIDRPEIRRELIEVAEKLARGWKEQNSPEDVPAPAPTLHSSLRQNIPLPSVRQQAATPPRDGSSSSQEASEIDLQHLNPLFSSVPGPPADITQPRGSSSHQPSPSTMRGSTLAPDTLGEDIIDIGSASDQVEPSDTTPLSLEKRAHDPLPAMTSPQPAHPTGSLSGTTPESSPHLSSAQEVGPSLEMNNSKELSMAFGGQFAQESS